VHIAFSFHKHITWHSLTPDLSMWLIEVLAIVIRYFQFQFLLHFSFNELVFQYRGAIAPTLLVSRD